MVQLLDDKTHLFHAFFCAFYSTLITIYEFVYVEICELLTKEWYFALLIWQENDMITNTPVTERLKQD